MSAGRARRLAGRRFKRAATAGRGTGRSVERGAPRSTGSSRRRRRGGGPAGRSSAAPHGVQVQAGGDGAGRGGVEVVARVRRPTEYRFKRAVTAQAGAGLRWSPGCGAPRSTGSSRQRRQRKGRGEGDRPGAAPHGVQVQAGGDGAGRGGVEVVARVRRPTGRRSKQAATAEEGAGRRRSPGCGAPQSTGSSWRRGRGGAPAGRSGAAERVGAVGVGSRGGIAAPASPGRRGRPPGNRRLPLTWANTRGDGGVGCPAHRDVTPVTSRHASRPGSALGRPERPRSGRR